MKGLTTREFIEILKLQIPELPVRLTPAKSSTQLDRIEQKLQVKLPTALKELYEICDGDLSVGMFLGLQLMSQESILETINFFADLDTVYISGQGNSIREDYISNLKLIPFAFDAGRCYFVLDFSPADNGKAGQVIAIDLEYDCSYLVADSVEEFYDLIKMFLDDGRFFVSNTEGEVHFEFQSGHFFNQLPQIMQPVEENDRIILPDGYWKDQYKNQLTDGKLSKEVLKKITYLNIEHQKLSCQPFLEMENLKELRLWGCELSDFEVLGQVKNLKELTLGICKLNAEQISSISVSKSIRTMRFARGTVEKIGNLADLLSLHELTLFNMEGIRSDELAKLTQLKILDIDETLVDQYDFFQSLTKLKELEIHQTEMENINFLQYFPNLVRFTMQNKAKNEDGLCYLNHMKKLKTFDYPVSDLSVYLGHEKLEDIGVSVIDTKNIEALQKTNVTGVMIYDGSFKTEVQSLMDEIKKYTHLIKRGYKGNF